MPHLEILEAEDPLEVLGGEPAKARVLEDVLVVVPANEVGIENRKEGDESRNDDDYGDHSDEKSSAHRNSRNGPARGGCLFAPGRSIGSLILPAFRRSGHSARKCTAIAAITQRSGQVGWDGS